MNDVQTLSRLLKFIEDATQPDSARLPLEGDFVQSTISEAETTLQACDKLITNNNHFKRSRDGMVVNIVWAIGIKNYVQQQQARIQVCCHRANLVLRSCAESNLSQNQRTHLEVTQIYHEEVRHLLRNRPDIDPTILVSLQIASRFQSSMAGMPSVTRRLDAAYYFHEAYTRTFQPQPPLLLRPSPPQYLNLLKSIFLTFSTINVLEERIFTQDVYNKAYLDILQARVKKEVGHYLGTTDRFEIVSDEELLSQQADEFQVSWWQEKPLLLPGPLEPKVGETTIMSAALLTTDSTSVEQLRLFRISESRLRLAISRSRTDHAQQVVPTIESKELDCRNIYLNPTYAASIAAPSSIIWKAFTSDSSGEELAFETVQDARAFQEHITNFNVKCDIPAIDKIRKKSSLFDGEGKEIGDGGRLQIWMYRSALSNSDPQSGNPIDAGRHHQRNNSTTSGVTRSAESVDGTVRSSSTQHSSARSVQGGIYFEEPVAAQIILLTKLHGKLRTISIRIDEHTHLSPDKCWCSSNRECSEVIVDSSKKVEVSTHATTAAASDWNVAVFGHYACKQQLKTGFKTITTHADVHEIQKEQVKYVSISFRTVEDRRLFQERFELACNIVRNQVDGHHRDLRDGPNVALYDAE